MVKRKLKPFVLPILYLVLVLLFFITTYLLTKSLQVANVVAEEKYVYVSYEVLMDNTVPVIGEEDNTLIRPYTSENISIGKAFYNYEQEDSIKENAILYFENTYIQNYGVDYVSPDVFNVICVLDGTVMSITEDDIVGKTVKVRHDEETISIYQSLGDVYVEENAEITKGEVIGKSGTNAIGSDLGNHLHFEFYYNNKLVDPELYYETNIGVE